MRKVERSAIVPFPPEAMFDLVADVESYPQFLPGCSGAKVSVRDGDIVIGTVSLAQEPLRFQFSTRNVLDRPRCITMDLQDGPFRQLSGSWRFTPLGEGGCRVSLELAFAFDSRVAEALLGPPFEALCNRLVDAFVQRARRLRA